MQIWISASILLLLLSHSALVPALVLQDLVEGPSFLVSAMVLELVLEAMSELVLQKELEGESVEVVASSASAVNVSSIGHRSISQLCL